MCGKQQHWFCYFGGGVTLSALYKYHFCIDNNVSTHVKESGFRNPYNFCSWNPVSWALESRIQLKESGILLMIEIQ